MGDAGGFFRGTSTEQDARFSDKYKKYVAGRKFPPEFDLKVDLRKVAMDAIKPWVASRITQLLGFEDEVLIGFAFGLLDDKESLNPKELQLNLDGFLEADSPQFVADLWKLLLSAQASPGGIPAEFLEQKKAQLRQKREEESRVKSDLSAVISRDKERLMQEIEQRRAQPPPVPAPAVAAGGYSTKTALPYGLFVPDAKQPTASQTDLANAASNPPSAATVNHGRSEEGSRRRSDRDADSDRDRRRTDRQRSRERGHRGRSADRDRDRRRDRDKDRRSRRERRSRSRSRSRGRGRGRDDSRERERARDGATDSGGRERGDRRQSRDHHHQQQRDERARRSGSEERAKRKRDEGSSGTGDRPDDRRRRDNNSTPTTTTTTTTTTTGGNDGTSSPTPAKRARPDGHGPASPVDRRQQQQEQEQQEASDPHLLESALREQAMHSLLHRSRERSEE